MPLSSFARSRPAVLAGSGLLGLGLVAALAGCSTTAAGSGSAGSSGSSSSGSTTPVSGPFTDGTYSADGSYTAPSGTETITVTLTLAGDKVTAVQIGKHATDPNAVEYQAMFANGIGALVVGKDVSTLDVTRVAGSSLTSNGFRAALQKIEQQAKS